MSLPDYLLLCRRADLPPKFSGFPHSVALLPDGFNVEDLGKPENRQSGAFLVEPGCAHQTLSDPALNAYLMARTPVIVCARARTGSLDRSCGVSSHFSAVGTALRCCHEGANLALPQCRPSKSKAAGSCDCIVLPH